MDTRLKALIIDTETTGLGSDAEATELGWCEVFFNGDGILQMSGEAQARRCKPDKDISVGAMTITGIYPEDVAGEPSHKEVIPLVVNDSCSYVIGHNIDFDMNIVNNAGVKCNPKRICTLALARALLPMAENHKLATILHMLDYDYAKENSSNAHSAKHDTLFCFRILSVLCEQQGISCMEDVYQLSESSRIPKRMPFGKHKGMQIEKLPESYKRYMAENVSDEYLRRALTEAMS